MSPKKELLWSLWVFLAPDMKLLNGATLCEDTRSRIWTHKSKRKISNPQPPSLNSKVCEIVGLYRLWAIILPAFWGV